MSPYFLRRLPCCLGGLAVAIALTTPATAHVKLMTSNPANNTEVTAPAIIEMRFNEDLIARVTHVRLTASTGEDIPLALTIPIPAAVIVKPARPLLPGRYSVRWSTASENDGHKMAGAFLFTVK